MSVKSGFGSRVVVYNEIGSLSYSSKSGVMVPCVM